MQDTTPTDHGIMIEMETLPAVNLAMQQNRVPIIRQLRILNRTGRDLAGVALTLTPEPSFADPVQVDVGNLAVNESRELDVPRLNLQHNVLAPMTEGMAGSIRSTITTNNEPVARQTFPIQVLAYDQWCGNGVLPEMLAAFVTPNHPAIAPILRRAAEWMETWTGRSALDEYQSRQANRVRQQMAALYAALAEQDIAYASTPASFGAPGQRVRLADKVLENKLGNCIELSLLYAACLEAAGIHPLVILIENHAFAGGWLIPDTFPDSITDDGSFLSKRTADGVNEIVVLEATSLTQGGKTDFENAVKEGQRHLVDADTFLYTLDVKRCRFAGIQPIPQRIQEGDRWILPQDAPAMDAPTAAPQSVTPYDLPQQADTLAPTKQMMWERKLLDLSLRNNLLNIRITKNSLQLLSANLHDVEDALADGAEFRILPRPTDWDSPLYEFGLHRALAPSDPMIELVKSELAQNRLRAFLPEVQLPVALTHLYRASRLALEESGTNTLYIALGLLKWFETDGSERPRYAPILLLPIEIIRKTSAKGYVIRSRDEEPFLNITLLEMLRQNFNLTIPGLDPLPRDERGVDVRKLYTILRHGIKNQRRWDVDEIAMLGLFSFNTFVMWNDIHAHAAKMARNPAVASLMSGKLEWQPPPSACDARELDRTTSPADILLPVPADSSQLEAVYEAVNGSSFILHGPPGTGKSQTITNIIANALYRGKRVLFVAEKMAALAVVEDRLRKIGLGPFCLELHSNKAQKSSVIAQLKETTEVIRQQSPAHFAQEAKRIYTLRSDLNAYVQALHKRHPFGFSLYEAVPRYQGISGEQPFVFPPDLLDGMDADTLGEWRDAVEALSNIGSACGHPHGHPLEGIGIADYSAAVQAAAEASLAEWRSQLQARQPHLELITRITGIPIPPAVSTSLLPPVQRLFASVLAMPACTPMASLLGLDAGTLLAAWDVHAAQWFLPRWSGQRAIRRQIRQHLATDPGTLDVRHLLTCLVEIHAALRELVADVTQLTAIKSHLARQLAEGTGTFRDLYRAGISALGTWADALRHATESAQKILDLEVASSTVFEQAQAQAEGWAEHLGLLKDWSRWIAARNRLRSLGIGHVAETYKTQAISPALLPAAFDKSFYQAAITTIIAGDPALAMFNGDLFGKMIRKYQATLASYEDLVRQELCARLAASIPAFSIEATQNSEVGILQRNIRNGARGTPIRKLFDQIPTLLPRMCPCMLMSPMSVAQYLDVDDLFDLVIFDEASQMPTSQAVGTLARGKVAIIVGDPKQMPPTSFFATQSVDEENIDMEDMDSILDDGLALTMPSKYLLWHYRSRHESLIAFSNAQYYDNALYTFPSPDHLASKVVLVHVPGYYDKGRSRTNRAEADAIVGDIERRLSDPVLREQSIGVVTFSAVQQDLVEDLLGELFVRRPDLELVALERAEPIFIKNLENVQGDERDVILFSICYGPDEQGRVSMNFGPLNRKGGERRLNVAVSRARQEMTVFSTLQPEAIDLNRTSAEGVVGLRRFLEYARQRPVPPVPAAVRQDTPSLTRLIAEKLRERGHTLHTHVGTSRYRVDMAIVDPANPSRYLLGILCDGEIYAGAKTARDREIVQRETLRRLGWRLHQVWTMDWITDPQGVLKGIESALASHPEPPAPPVNSTRAPKAPVVPPAVPAPLPVVPEITMPRRDNPAEIPMREIIAVLTAHTAQQVSLPEDELLRLAARSFGYARIGTNIEAVLRQGLDQAKAANHLRGGNDRISLGKVPQGIAGGGFPS